MSISLSRVSTLTAGFLVFAVLGLFISQAMAISGKECDDSQAGGNCAFCFVNGVGCDVDNPGEATGTCVDKTNSQCQSPAICSGMTLLGDSCSCPANGCD